MDKSKEAVAVFDKYAEGYQQRFMDVSAYAKSLDVFCETISKQKANVLELACGPGNVTRYVLNKRPDLKVLATDLAPNMLVLAKQNNPEVETMLLDSREFKSLQKKFDAILCAFCLPYLNKSETLKLIKDAAEVLNPEGVLYLSTMEDEHGKSGYKAGSKGDLIYMNFHEGTYLKKALEENAFQVLHEERMETMQSNGEMAIDLVLVGKRV